MIEFFRNAEQYWFGGEDGTIGGQQRVLTAPKPTEHVSEPPGSGLALGTEDEQGPRAEILPLQRSFAHSAVKVHITCFETGPEQKAA